MTDGGEPMRLRGFLLGLLQTANLTDSSEQRVSVNRLEQIIGRTMAQGRKSAVQIEIARHDDYRRTGRQPSKLRQSLVRRDASQFAIEQNHLKLGPIGAPQRPSWRLGKMDLVTLLLQDVLQ